MPRLVRSSWAVLVIAFLAFGQSPTVADEANPSTSAIDNYALLTGSAVSKQGFGVTNSSLLDGVANFTVEGWIKPDASNATGSHVIFIKQDAFILKISNGYYQYQFHSGSSWLTPVNLDVLIRYDEWNHISIVKTGTQVEAYYNGGKISSVDSATYSPANTATPTGNKYLGLGGNPWNTSNSTNENSPQSDLFAGGLDEFRVWPVARTAAEISGALNAKSNPSYFPSLAAAWDFNGTTSTTIHDRTSNGNNLTAYGSPTYPDVKTTSIQAGIATITFPRTYLNSTGVYEIPSGVTQISALVVGGGGGGGYDGGGGGGGGGVYETSTMIVAPGDQFAVVVGGGGTAGIGYSFNGACFGGWASDAIGCSGGSGQASRFSRTGLSASASGGGGGGGIEASGLSVSRWVYEIAGGGGGAGGQNSLSTTPNPGAGEFSGGSVTNVAENGGGGGGSSTAAGGSVTGNRAGDGATGLLSSWTNLVYGSGGGGGSYSSYVVATGGSGAADGGTYTNAPTIPAVNRGGGGGGGGRGTVYSNAWGSQGAAGVVIIRYALQTSGTISIASTPLYRTATSITVSASVASRVTLYANSKKIAGCISKRTVSLTYTCSWRPTTHGLVKVFARIVPIDDSYPSSTVELSPVGVGRRSGLR